jgi:hypothetical protein
MKTDLKEAYLNMHTLTRQERVELLTEIRLSKPDFMKEYTPKWWWFRPCEVNVLLVTDGGLDFETGGFGLSEFITTFNKLQQQSFLNVRYKVTIGHRGGIMPVNPNPVIVNRLANFNFNTSVTLNDFDQVWLFGIDSGTSISAVEISKIEAYMNGGGGLFATGDHGTLGSAMCSQIPRVSEMRYWADFGAGEVSMSGDRRNDTNRPGAGQTTSTLFQNQSDNIPQTIAVRTFGSGMPHPLLSISTSKRASGIIDIMPDHPHEGECQPEKVFTVTNPVTTLPQSVSTQIIATSFVLGGSVSGGKDATQPHCFPSISVFDGRVANIGRISIDSTWHHFVNINLIGAGAGVGLTSTDFDTVQQYYMNIANWITRQKTMFCWWRWIWIYLLKDSQLIEASLNFPGQKLQDIKLADLNSIGMLAKEIIADNFSPVFAEEFLTSMIETSMPDLANHLNVWKPITPNPDKKVPKNDYYHGWISFDNLIGTAIGAGFISLRDKFDVESKDFNEKSFDRIYDIFNEGVNYGVDVSMKNLQSSFDTISKNLLKKKY